MANFGFDDLVLVDPVDIEDQGKGERVAMGGLDVFRDRRIASWFRSAMLWFGFVVAGLATVQTFTSDKIFWLFSTEYGDVMGPILYHNHFAAFLEVVLPITLYETLRRDKGGLMYAGMAAVMYASIIASASRSGPPPRK